VEDVRVSTTHIKEPLSDGKIELANVMLGENYSVSGKVIDGRKVGRKLGIPTINLAVDKTCLFLKDGVYSGRTEIDGKEFKLVINYGGRPTFNLDEKLIEAHIIDYSGDLYGKEVKIEFLSYIRGLYAFRDQDQLKEQIKKDIERVNTDD
jgi:riboflavin kinase/FMN adenylyltransferase